MWKKIEFSTVALLKEKNIVCKIINSHKMEFRIITNQPEYLESDSPEFDFIKILQTSKLPTEKWYFKK